MGSKKVCQKILKKFSKIEKNIVRTMVKTPAQTDGWFKSYSQKTAQKWPFLKVAIFGQFFGYNF